MIVLHSRHFVLFRSLLVASESGLVQLLPFSGDSEGAGQAEGAPPAVSWTVPANVYRMRLEETGERVFATGGKEHLLRVWDIETGKLLFRERNVHTCLSYRMLPY